MLGDGEDLLVNFVEAYKAVRHADRQTQLRALAQVPGVYVPSLYELSMTARRDQSQSIRAIQPEFQLKSRNKPTEAIPFLAHSGDAPRRLGTDLYGRSGYQLPRNVSLLPGELLNPTLSHPSVAESLIPAIERGLAVTNRIGLLGASVTQHPEFETLLDYLSRPEYDSVRLSLASVRTNTVTLKLAQTLAMRDSRSITIRIESGSERLRQIINKKAEQQ